jgi:5-methylcytosine-specific restriction endonuclease McrA
MTRWEKIKNDPEKLKQHNQWKRNDYAKKMNRIKTDPKKWVKFQSTSSKKWEEKKNMWYKKNEADKTFIERMRQSNNQRTRRYYYKHPLKVMAGRTNTTYKQKETISGFDLWRIAKSQKLICPFTGRKLTKENISIDHIIPKSKGGHNVLSNIRLVHKQANIGKNNTTDTEFLQLCKDVVNQGYSITR